MEYGDKSVCGSAATLASARRTPQAVLLDLDGTLVDTLGDFVLALQGMLEDVAPAWAQPGVQTGEVEPLVGRGAENLVQQLLLRRSTQFSAPAPTAAALRHAVAVYLAHYGRINGQQSRVYDGVAEALELWRARGLRLACVTNKPQQHAQELLDRLGLSSFLDVIVGAQEGLRKKPHPDALLRACSLLAVEPVRALMVGDSANDVQAARAAQCPVVLVDYGYNHGESVHQAGADAVLDSLRALAL